MSLKSLLSAGAAVATLAVLAPAANAASISQTASIALSTTNWTKNFTPTLNLFDTTLGTLTSVQLKLNGQVVTDFKVESLDNAPSIVTLDSSAKIELRNPSNVVLLTANAAGQVIQNLSDFDGTIDFDGTSGTTQLGVSGSDSVSTTYTGAAMNPFIGVGTFTFNGVATGLSNGSGAGNLISQISTKASADLELIYNYDTGNAVPEPGAVAMIGASMLAGGFAVVRRRRK